MSHQRKYTYEYLAPLVKESTNFTELLRKIGVTSSGSLWSLIRRRVDEFGIDRSHFIGVSSNKGRVRRTPAEVFSQVSTRRLDHATLRNALLRDGVSHKCAVCGAGPEWCGRPLTLQVDHIDSDFLNNAKSNLRFLCPNCHTQTEDYGPKGLKQALIVTACVVCEAPVSVTPRRFKRGNCYCGKKCSSSIATRREKADWPSDSQLKSLVWEMPTTKIAKNLGVSGTAVKQRCLARGIDTPSRGFWTKK